MDDSCSHGGGGADGLVRKKKQVKSILRESSYSVRTANQNHLEDEMIGLDDNEVCMGQVDVIGQDAMDMCMDQDVDGSQEQSTTQNRDHDDQTVESSTSSTCEDGFDLVWWSKKWIKVE